MTLPSIINSARNVARAVARAAKQWLPVVVILWVYITLVLIFGPVAGCAAKPKIEVPETPAERNVDEAAVKLQSEQESLVDILRRLKTYVRGLK